MCPIPVSFPSVVKTGQVMGVSPSALDSLQQGRRAPIIKTDMNRGVHPGLPFPSDYQMTPEMSEKAVGFWDLRPLMV